MNISIVIPAHNEAAFLKGCLESICIQTLAPQQLIVVSDNSSDNTYKIAQEFAEKHSFITAVNHSSSNIHMPGSKVVQAFNFGLKQLDKDYDILLKFVKPSLNNESFFILEHKLIFKYFSKLKDPKSSSYLEFETYFSNFYDFCFELPLEYMVRDAVNFRN